MGPGPRDVFDAACGIGTQALGLAALGHRVTASDLSRAAVDRAAREPRARSLDIAFSVCDMRAVAPHHRRRFEVVLCADNSLPHLVDDDEILEALQAFRACTASGGACVVSVRDHDAMERAGVQVRPYGVRLRDGDRHVVFQVLTWHGDRYDVDLYVVRDSGRRACRTDVFRASYYAIGTDRLLELLRQAGFDCAERRDDAFFQPVLIGRRGGARA